MWEVKLSSTLMSRNASYVVIISIVYSNINSIVMEHLGVASCLGYTVPAAERGLLLSTARRYIPHFHRNCKISHSMLLYPRYPLMQASSSLPYTRNEYHEANAYFLNLR
ncbi:unnamed protein product [Albugo candida]|uniref:Uncharacterized protein n=1 Tax=Albugo candida TaxID=65357 RepID=A0A024GNH4_9STRA|nr:unnamed protein product [Albugo candida]|eukprot:CCI48339.1 unnamed protein product [Albugo candida]